jgi:hypothetical protein
MRAAGDVVVVASRMTLQREREKESWERERERERGRGGGERRGVKVRESDVEVKSEESHGWSNQ